MKIKALQSFEPFSIKDWLIIPWFAFRYFWFWLIFRLLVVVRGNEIPRGQSRHTDPTPVWCERCMWTGPVRQLFHTYSEWEPVSECPRCGMEM